MILVEYELSRGAYALRNMETREVISSSLSHGMAIDRIDAPRDTCIALLAAAKRAAYISANKLAKGKGANDG